MAEETKNPDAEKDGTPEVVGENAPPTATDVAPKAPKPATEKPAGAAAGERAEKPKKEKAPALEDKPFTEFINQDFLPNLKKTLANQGIQDIDLQFVRQALPIRGMEAAGECWQIIGHLPGKRQFILGFLKDDIQSSKIFSYSDSDARPSTVESFMIDERKVTLDLLLLYAVQRLNGQKWLVRN